MMYLLPVFLSLSCFLSKLEWASRVEIEKPFELVEVGGQPDVDYLTRLYEASHKEGELDVRVLALAWMETRLKSRHSIGDSGRACGPFQIHARYSYPLFRRKNGAVGWVEKNERETIQVECGRLKRLDYSADTVHRLLDYFDHRQMPPCHHNSGFGRCDSWYEERLDFWVTYFQTQKLLCDERMIETMAMMKTGTPVASAPNEKVQGYLDAMAGKPAENQNNPIYMAGYALAERVKKGEEEAPTWAL